MFEILLFFLCPNKIILFDIALIHMIITSTGIHQIKQSCVAKLSVLLFMRVVLGVKLSDQFIPNIIN